VWTFNISAGLVLHNGLLLDSDTYSGAWPEGFNNPKLEAQRDVGPICEGFWTICGPPFDNTEHGKYILRLEPDKTTITYDRVGFLWHGKLVVPKGVNLLLPSPYTCCASKGCMCSEYETRMRVYQSGDTRLQVISGISQVTAGIPQQKDFP